MAWNLKVTGTTPTVLAAIAALGTGNGSVEEITQIASAKTYILAEIAAEPLANTGLQIDLTAYGNRTLNSSVMHVRIQSVKLTNAGDVATGIPPTRLTGEIFP